MAGKSSGCEGCPGREACLQTASDPSAGQVRSAVALRMGAVRHRIVVLSGKGGVGKSTVACGLAQAFAATGAKVGAVDVDVCGPSLGRLLGVQGLRVQDSPWGWKPLISPHGQIKVMTVDALLQGTNSPVIFRGPRKTNLIQRFLKDVLWSRLDFLIFDTPPGSSDEHLAVVKLLQQAQPAAVLVTSPQRASQLAVARELKFCRQVGLPVLGLVENMSGFACPCCKEVAPIFAGRTEEFAAEHSLPILGRLPFLQPLTQACDAGNNLLDNEDLAQRFQDLAGAVVARLEP